MNSIVFSINNSQAMSAQAYMYEILRNRGYSKTSLKPFNPKTFKSAPLTTEQQSTYNRFMVELVRRATDDDLVLASYFHSQLCNNPCMASGESFLHLLCRYGDGAFLQLVTASQAQQGGGLMPTPLQMPESMSDHASSMYGPASFLMTQLILERDISQLVRKDAEGALPLQLVPRECHREWNGFLDIVRDMYWPEAEEDDSSSSSSYGDVNDDGGDGAVPVEPSGDETRDENKKARLHVSLARMVNTSRMSLDEAVCLQYEGGDDDDTTTHGHDLSFSSIGDLEEGVADLMFALDQFMPKRIATAMT